RDEPGRRGGDRRLDRHVGAWMVEETVHDMAEGHRVSGTRPTCGGNRTTATKPPPSRPRWRVLGQTAPVTIHAVPRARRPVVTARASMNRPAKATHDHPSPATPSSTRVRTATAAGA